MTASESDSRRARSRHFLKVCVIVLIYALAALIAAMKGPWWLAVTFAFGATLWLWRGARESQEASTDSIDDIKRS